MGREDDLLLINFMTGARDVVGAQEKRLSNTMNPFCNGSSSMLSQLVVSLMDSGSVKVLMVICGKAVLLCLWKH